MLLIALREFTVLILGCGLSFLRAKVLGDADGNFEAFAAALLIPIAYCLLRASLVQRPAAISGLRSVAYQVCLAAALVLLLLFETAFGMLFGSDDVPLAVWLIVGAFGVGYVVLFCLARQIGLPCPPELDA